MRENSDPAVREGCPRSGVRAKGPRGRRPGLVDAMTQDPTGTSGRQPRSRTTVLYFRPSPDWFLRRDRMVKSMGSSQLDPRPLVWLSEPSITHAPAASDHGLRPGRSADVAARRLAVAAVGSVGQGLPSRDDGDQREPRPGAVTLLLASRKPTIALVGERDQRPDWSRAGRHSSRRNGADLFRFSRQEDEASSCGRGSAFYATTPQA